MTKKKTADAETPEVDAPAEPTPSTPASAPGGLAELQAKTNSIAARGYIGSGKENS